MEFVSNSTRNSFKLYPNSTLNSNFCELNVTTNQLVFNENTVIPSKNEKYYYKSRIRTGLTPRIERRGLSVESQSGDNEAISPRTSIPCKDYKSHTGLLDQGIHIRKINTTLKNETGEKLKNYLYKKQKEDKNILTNKEILTELPNQTIPFRDSFLIIQKSKISIFELQARRKRKCRSSLKRVDAPIITEIPKIHRKNLQKVEKVLVKDAIRDKEWTSRSKPQITKSFNTQINRSNGLAIEIPIDTFFYYKYYLGKGNNSNLIKQCLSTRWWWIRVNEEEISNANLVWTQWKDKKTLESLPKLSVNHEIDSKLSVTITTNARYNSPQSRTRPKLVDITSLGYNLITRSKSFITLKPSQYKSAEMRMHNKIEHNFHLANKKALFYNMKSYYEILGDDVFNVLPLTFHVKSNDDPVFLDFERSYKFYEESVDDQGKKPANIWIVKPGENSNRGNGIIVCANIEQVKNELQGNPHLKTGKHTFIIQKYIEKPFLVNKRKFDIRCFGLVTCLNGCLQGYFYSEGYLRTACKQFTLQTTNKFIHLTNDAVQKYSDDYGKFENGNKMSYNDFQRYLDNHYERSVNFIEEILPQIKNIVKRTFEAVLLKIDPNVRGHSFEIFGYDFLLDSDLKPWLLEVNTNPCLELSSPHLARIIPSMLENAFRIAIDPVFQEPSSHFKHPVGIGIGDIPENKFELVFHSLNDGEMLKEKLENRRVFDAKEIEELSEEADELQEEDDEDV
ncbi:hypothetical protein SteCoe_7833 [Stentor coeruleus]|uniref:Tubulin--tyrosine ligase-like protein 9 n=1 Tax=Stentor coeruleus TaxID=5963 RepID=A0A1R2CLX0_9CILI|nr:hypothetical protein SteCoe_7833 [Stentor coeruleus]